ncbi:hypothetical protein Pcinc_006108 [Petrolisthes cinctipes]|uniref:Uncharacterized protein n=1 Tax=Petrolisthes cinctipes TaxID=88211 RepID=A0AAE1KYE2_PETCI|nr:hypothetical protein Pcinc_006108 [Petrolisthes cinctipes]
MSIIVAEPEEEDSVEYNSDSDDACQPRKRQTNIWSRKWRGPHPVTPTVDPATPGHFADDLDDPVPITLLLTLQPLATLLTTNPDNPVPITPAADPFLAT